MERIELERLWHELNVVFDGACQSSQDTVRGIDLKEARIEQLRKWTLATLKQSVKLTGQGWAVLPRDPRVEPYANDMWTDENGGVWSVWVVAGSDKCWVLRKRLTLPEEERLYVSLEAFQKQVEKWKPF